MRPLVRFHLVLAFALLGTACATAPAPGSGTEAPRADGGLLVEVQNDNPGDFEIFLVRDGTTVRLGLVTSGGFARFEVERARFSGQGQVGLLAQALGGTGRYQSPTVLVSRGERLVLDLSPELRFSSVSVRR